MLSATNPGIKASFTDTLQRCVIGILIIMTAPVFIDLLIGINDALVKLFADTLNYLVSQEVNLELGVTATL